MRDYIKNNFLHLLIILLLLLVISLQVIVFNLITHIKLPVPVNTNNTYIVDSTRRELFQQHTKSIDSTYNTPLNELAKQIEQWNKLKK